MGCNILSNGVNIRYMWTHMNGYRTAVFNLWIVMYRFWTHTVYPKKYAHGYCFAVLCCGYTLTGFPISIRLTSLALWQSNDFPSASKATLMNMDKHFMWIHYERLHNHNKAKHNKTMCIFLGIYCKFWLWNGGKHGIEAMIRRWQVIQNSFPWGLKMYVRPYVKPFQTTSRKDTYMHDQMVSKHGLSVLFYIGFTSIIYVYILFNMLM